jgi:hypothetical protein
MKVLSIDVGIKNLAFCLFEKPNDSEHFKILKWNVVNICDAEKFQCCFPEKGVICNKPAKYRNHDQYFCLKHSKKQDLQFPTSETTPAFIAKQKIQKLYEIANKYNIKYEKTIKKCELVTIINEYIQINYFKTIETTNASKQNLINIGQNLKTALNNNFSNDTYIEYVIIENQIGPIATRMKTIQGMIVQYFIMSDILVDNVEFISASNKLKEFIKEDNANAVSTQLKKLKYSDRKKLGTLKCLETISNDHRFKDLVQYFNSSKKKDDLADAFLQGFWFINANKL